MEAEHAGNTEVRGQHLGTQINLPVDGCGGLSRGQGENPMAPAADVMSSLNIQ